VNRIQNKEILVVDDDELFREVMMELLTSEGGQVSLADSGKKALELIEKSNFDFIISDVRMKEGDGIDLARGFRRLNKRPLLFICSGYNDLDIKHAKEMHIEKIFEKPFDPTSFIEELNEILLRYDDVPKNLKNS